MGTVTVPCYLAPSCSPGGQFELDGRGLPTRDDTWDANFDCIIPRSAVEPYPSPARPSLYGHGLFGSASEVASAPQRDLAGTYNLVLCATDEIGMSRNDLPTAFGILGDLSGFPKLVDRVQQGLLDELYLGRAMIHRDGFSSDPAFHVDGTLRTPSVVDTTRLYYDGNSQGGILGGALTALSPDFTRAALGVPGMNYSLLLPRSVDFDAFAAILYPNFPADVEARTIGARAHVPILDPGRWPGVDVLWHVPPIARYPFAESAVFYWDIGPVRPDPANPGRTLGVPPPPLENVPNRAGEDPHGAPRGAPQAEQLISEFLRPRGGIDDVCGGQACHAGGWTGP